MNKSLLFSLVSVQLRLAIFFSLPFIFFTSCQSPAVDAKEKAEPSPFSTGSYIVDADSSSLGWLGKKLTGQHAGNVRIREGALTVDSSGNLTDAHFVIDMQTISCTDIADSADNADLVSHLKDPDFFDVSTFPIASFRMTDAKLGEKGRTEVNGLLTIKDKSNAQIIPATIVFKDSLLEVSAAFSIDRTRWGVVYNSLKTLGDKVKDRAIDDDIRFTLHLIAKKKTTSGI